MPRSRNPISGGQNWVALKMDGLYMLPSGYLTVCHGKIHPFLRTVNHGKPSISIRAIEKPWLC